MRPDIMMIGEVKYSVPNGTIKLRTMRIMENRGYLDGGFGIKEGE